MFRFIRYGAVAAGLALVIASAAPAVAQESASGHARFCAAEASTHPTATAAPAVSCFVDFRSAIAYATGGRVQLAAGTTRLSQAELDSVSAAVAPNSTVVIGIDYVDAYYKGNTFVWYTSHLAGCTDGTSFYANTMPSGWNDVVSSAAAYQGCDFYTHYENTYQGGAYVNCTCQTMGVMNDATSSESWEKL